MKIIISPAKKMKIDTDSFAVQTQPVFLEDTKRLLAYLQTLSLEQLQDLWQCSQKLAQANYLNVMHCQLTKNQTPALFAYVGIQYQSMGPDVFTKAQLDYVKKHLRILSGFYGLLRPFDGIVPYRLEMQAKIDYLGYQSLYAFWAKKLYQQLFIKERQVLNLASSEYAKAISPYVKKEQQFVTCLFGELKNGKLKQKATALKLARGQMVQFLARKQITDLKQVKTFNELGYRYLEDFSTVNTYVFAK